MAEEEEEEEEEETHYSECSSAVTVNAASCCRSLAIIFTILLLFRHVLALLCEGTGDYPFTLLTLVTLRAAGILLPMYVLIRMITAIQNTLTPRHHQQYQRRLNCLCSPFIIFRLSTFTWNPSSTDADNDVNPLQPQHQRLPSP